MMKSRPIDSPMNRRKFLQSVLVAGTASLVVPARIFGASGPNERINIAQIGCGRQGRSNISNALAVAERLNARMVAVCDVNRRRAEDAATLIQGRQAGDESIGVYTDYRELLERSDIDAVMIATADHSHGMIALDAVRAGKDIYLEKPLTYGIKEGRELVEAVRQHRRILQVGTQQRSSVYFRRVCELVRGGKLGQIQSMDVRLPMDGGTADASPMPVPPELDYQMWLKPGSDFPYTEARVHPQEGYGRPGWMQISAHGRGMMANWGAHMLDIAAWGIGMEELPDFTLKGTAEFPERGLFDTHTALSADLTFPDGFIMHVTSGSEASPGVRFEGSEGWADVSRGKFDASDRRLLQEPADADRKLVFSDDHHGNWIESIRSRKAPVAPVEAGHMTNTLCVATLAACRMAPGKELSWNAQKEEFNQAPEANKILNL